MITLERRLSWLTDRERVVLHHLMEGRSAEEIAPLDYVSVTTVRTQIRHILQKLGVHSQLAAVALGYQAMTVPCTGCERAVDRAGPCPDQIRKLTCGGGCMHSPPPVAFTSHP